jgi:hypothetical protein
VSQRFAYYAPLDPDCPDNHMQEFWDDPMTAYSGCGDELAEMLEKEHRANCQRCKEYGLENIDIKEAVN